MVGLPCYADAMRPFSFASDAALVVAAMMIASWKNKDFTK